MTFASRREAVLAVRHAVSEIFEIAELMPACATEQSIEPYGREIETMYQQARSLRDAHRFLSTQRGDASEMEVANG